MADGIVCERLRKMSLNELEETRCEVDRLIFCQKSMKFSKEG